LDFFLVTYRDTKLADDLTSPFHPDFMKAVGFWAVIFFLFHQIFEPLAKFLIPKTYAGLKPQKKKDLSTYVISTVHHLVVVPYVSQFLLKDIFHYLADPTPVSVSHFDEVYSNFGVVSFSVGFFFGDGIAFYVPEALAGRPIYLLHHIFSICMLCATKHFSGVTLQAIPLMFLVEMSTAFFNIAWICRCLSNGKIPTVIISSLEYAFAVTFFFFRIIMGTFFLVLLFDLLLVQSQFFFVSYIAMLLLQYYWFYSILMSIFGGRRKKSNQD
jgi:hypothetical protein